MAELTPEQRRVLELLLAGSAFRVIAHAGSGKTTAVVASLLEMQRLGDTRRSLIVGYNRKLRLDTQAKVCASGSDRISVSNFDSILIGHYAPDAAEVGFAVALDRVLKDDTPLVRRPPAFDVLVIDEAQDLTESYRDLVVKLVRDSGTQCQLVLVGDPKQTIYQFRGASCGFFMADESAWGRLAPRTTVHFTATFRFGRSICDFVNAACRETFPPEWWGGDISPRGPEGRFAVFSASEGCDFDALVSRVIDDCKSGTAAILASSVRPAASLVWSFVERYNALGGQRPLLDEEDEDEARGRPTLRTVFRTKGAEFDVVVLFVDARFTSELLYVGLTRARRSLLVVRECDALGEGLLGDDWCRVRGVEVHSLGAPAGPQRRPRRRRSVYASDHFDRCGFERRGLELLRDASTAVSPSLTTRRWPALQRPLTNRRSISALGLRLDLALSLSGARAEARRLFVWLGCRRSSIDSCGRAVPLLPDVAAALDALPESREQWSAEDWCALALATERCRWGHVFSPPPAREDLAAVERLFESCSSLAAEGWRASCPSLLARGSSCELLASSDLILERGGDALIVDLECREERPPQRHVGAALALLAMGRVRVSALLAQCGLEFAFAADRAYSRHLAASTWPSFF